MIFAPLLIIFAAFLWALDGIVLRPSLYVLPVGIVVFVEHALAFLLMLPFLIKERKEIKKFGSEQWGVFLWIAVFGGVLGTMFITKALFYVNFINLSIVVLIQKLQPIFALLLAALILKEKLPKKFFAWASLAIVATYLIAFDNLIPNFNTGDKTLLAALFALGAAFSWGSSTVFGKKALQTVNFRVATYMRFGLTALIMFFVVSLTSGFSEISAITDKQWLTFLIIIFSSGAAAMFIYYYGLRKVKASSSAIYELTFPLSAIILEMIVHHKFLTWTQWIGAIVLMFTVWKISSLKE